MLTKISYIALNSVLGVKYAKKIKIIFFFYILKLLNNYVNIDILCIILFVLILKLNLKLKNFFVSAFQEN